ncbi:oligosaccharide flippase family protein [Algoriphagus sp. CAU 1675]|uniref:lipopolysaccharide biosynthesis protein n=1 Tax=Algoriphagus sp. CAU 1675 TaxID=3032597 RepID=UPI0023DB3515|nr:oligosaccharide flippase family protein [Algoriphagus sp. CAU 1675]MDF2158191.1 oligosaccharide flippase family protein [Algoriphagus sp. CAU 1675]
MDFIKKFLIYGFSPFLGKILSIFLMPIYTSILSKEDFGAMAIIFSIKSVIDMFSNLNIHSGVARYYYNNTYNIKYLLSTSFLSIVVLSVFISFLMYMLLGKFVLLDFTKHEYYISYILMFFTIPSGSLNSFFSIISRFKNIPYLYFLGSIINVLIHVGISLILIIYFKLGIVGFFGGLFISDLFLILYFYVINKNSFSFIIDFNILKTILKFSIPTIPAIFGEWIDSSLGQIFIGKYFNLGDAGLYSVALRIASFFMFFNLAFNNVWLPYVYKYTNSHLLIPILLKFYKRTILLLSIVSFLLILFSDYIVLLLSNSSYLGASNFFTILCYPMSLNILSNFVRVGPQITQNTKVISYSSLIGSFVNLIFIFAFKEFGIYVVPIGLAFSKTINFILSNYFNFKELNFYFSYLYLLFLPISMIFSYFLKLLIF